MSYCARFDFDVEDYGAKSDEGIFDSDLFAFVGVVVNLDLSFLNLLPKTIV